MSRSTAKSDTKDIASSLPLWRAFGVIELVAMSSGGLTASEVAHHMNLPLVTAYRLLQRLSELGVLEGEGRGAKYIVGARLGRIAQTIAGSGSIVDRTRPIAQEIADEFGMVAYIAGLFEFEAYILAVQSPRTAKAPTVHPGRHFKIHALAGGKALLAYQPSWILRQLLAKPLERFTARTITDPDAFIAHLKDIRRLGYALSAGESEAGLWGIACPVHEGSGAVSYSVGLIAYEKAIDGTAAFAKRAAKRLKRAAAEIANVVTNAPILPDKQMLWPPLQSVPGDG
ncbi:IclR family transcriptional regulator [Hyphomicrobium sp. CS1BSMeth3]|uniref:IclR family transcriptional regulator n=1 Tax=Hyphomicrobium sp. CS1BSMeth3 TaxID=1892844 RepID=UPI0015750DE3|nr:IclR family transcriptional regulator [Hyphomicrobium sp. CS1BSMeth3]